MTVLERYLRHERLYLALMLTVVLGINNTINATSLLMEAQRAGQPIDRLAPFITEYSSALSSLLLIPLAVLWTLRFPLRWGALRVSVPAHVAGSLLFSICHVALFVGLRQILFGIRHIDYQFTDNLLVSFIYEYRKDAWFYCHMLAGVYLYRFVLSRLRGEATPIAAGEHPRPEQAPERFLVRKLGREFLVKVDDVVWLEAAGNYVNLHLDNRVYPLRTTMSGLLDRLGGRGFARIHRSSGVNLEFVESLTPQASGDSLVSLKGGQRLTLSRRYRDSFREQLERHNRASPTSR